MLLNFKINFKKGQIRPKTNGFVALGGTVGSTGVFITRCDL
jgi:hypothetical protein